MYPNVALCGALRSGKDTVAAYLCENYGYTRFAFGDDLKRLACEIFGTQTEGNKPRELLQWFGQTMRQRDPDVWVRKCFENIGYARACPVSGDENMCAVISDLRQPNEIERCRSEGYVIIRINAPDGVRIQRAVDSNDAFNYADLKHETESHVDSFAVDYDVSNDRDLAHLYAQIDAIIEKEATKRGSSGC